MQENKPLTPGLVDGKCQEDFLRSDAIVWRLEKVDKGERGTFQRQREKERERKREIERERERERDLLTQRE
jgi:hypothetical protein